MTAAPATASPTAAHALPFTMEMQAGCTDAETSVQP